MTIAQIAAAEGFCVWTVQKHLQGLGIRLVRKVIITPDDIQSIRDGHETARQVAARLGVSRNGVYQSAARAGMRISASRRPAQLDLFARAA